MKVAIKNKLFKHKPMGSHLSTNFISGNCDYLAIVTLFLTNAT